MSKQPEAVRMLAHDLYARITQLQKLRTSGIAIKEEMETHIAEAVKPLVEISERHSRYFCLEGCGCPHCAALARWRPR